MVYAIRRFNNFEYLAMELLGQSLGDIPDNVLKEIVPQVALFLLAF
jgi:hypothetical protein